MRLVRLCFDGRPRLAVLDPADPTRAQIAAGDAADPAPTGIFVGLRDYDLLPPVVPADILCIGLNYRDHAAETGATVPDHPMLFTKTGNALAGPADPVVVPRESAKVDFEAELAVVIKKDARRISADNAADYILGYTAANDVSARDWQKDPALNGGQFTRGKSFDRFCPLGPALITPDEVPDPHDLPVRLTLNGNVMQEGNTRDMIFDVYEILASLSRTLTVRAGSVILTGTPAGVGVARKPPVFLGPGDETTVQIADWPPLVTKFVADA